MKIITIVGARPQFIKAAVVSRAIENHNKENPRGVKIQEVIIHTGQHYDGNMSEIFFKELYIPKPSYNLGIGGSSHGAMTGRMLEQIEKIIMEERPDVVLVYGDTNSTLAGALAAVKMHIPVAHVEAGLRSYNMLMPEEINRILTDKISRWLFCPTKAAIKNLEKESILSSNNKSNYNQEVFNVGDVMYDAVLFYKEKAKPSEFIKKLVIESGGPYYLATVHREENTNNIESLSSILKALDEISLNNRVIFLIHPRTKKFIKYYHISLQRIHLIEPVGYLDMIFLLKNCSGVFTDSGGLQKEAYFFGKPCITLRNETEWVELVESGYNCLTGANYEKILDAEKKIYGKNIHFVEGIYGDGDAGAKIVKILLEGTS